MEVREGSPLAGRGRQKRVWSIVAQTRSGLDQETPPRSAFRSPVAVLRRRRRAEM